MCITSSVREWPKAISHWRWNVFIQKGNFLNLEHYLKRGLSYEMAISKKYCEMAKKGKNEEQGLGLLAQAKK